MKIDREAPHSSEAKPEPKERFSQLAKRPQLPPKAPGPKEPSRVAPHLRGARGPAGNAVARTAIASTLKAASEALGRARSGAHVEAKRLDSVRSESQGSQRERLEHRATDLIRRELERDLPTPRSIARSTEAPRSEKDAPSIQAAKLEGDRTAPAGAAAEAQPPPIDAASAVELVAKIEVFLKAARPGLTLELKANGLGEQVEVTKTGPGEVALRIAGGKSSPQAVEQLREALAAKGLRLSNLVQT